MWIDERAEFADATDTFADAADSTALIGDVMDLTTNRDIGQGHPLYLVIQVTTAYAGGTSVQFILASDSTAAIATTGAETRHLATDVWTDAQLTAGFTAVFPLPMGDTAQGEDTAGYERYLGILAVDVGTHTAGAINAFLTPDPYGWASYPDANN
jgi:hypothetical protein